MKKVLVIICLLVSLNAVAQEQIQGPENTKVEMAEKFRADGKIYVVIAVVCIILAGLIFYASSLDRRLGKLEKDNKPVS